MAMTAASWDMVDVSILRMNHDLSQSAIVDVKPSVTPATVTRSQIESTNFQKYYNIPLTNKNQTANFYDNLLSQASAYNIFIRPSMELTSNDGVIPDLLSQELQDVTATALYTKFCQADVINKSYTDAQNLLMATINGYNFLQLLIRQIHSLLSVYGIATVDITK